MFVSSKQQALELCYGDDRSYIKRNKVERLLEEEEKKRLQRAMSCDARRGGCGRCGGLKMDD
jgi:hypothetical protein